MTTTRRGANTYAASSASTSHNVPLPTGSVAGDLVLVVASNPLFATTFTMPGTQILNVGNNSMHYGVSKKVLVTGDITAGYLTVGTGASSLITAHIVGYSVAGDFSVGTVWSKGAVSLAYTTALAVADNGTDDILVFSLIKHSSASSQSYTSTSPSVTSLGTAILQGTGGVPSQQAGVYTGTPADRTNTWSVASTNGVGFQVAVLPVPIPPVLGVDWEDGAPSASGGAVTSGIVTTTDLGPYTKANFPQGAGTASLTWTTENLAAYSVRFYLHAPASWSDTAAAIFHAMTGSTLLPGLDVSGSLTPGQLRWKLNTSDEAFRTTAHSMVTSTVYRVEIQVDTVNNTIQGGLFAMGGTVPVYNSGVLSGVVGNAANKFSFGRIKNMASLPDFSISRIKVVNSVGSWIGRHSTDTLPGPPELLGVWNGTTIDETVALGIWNGTHIDATDTFFLL
jgi:hypothetical protein